MRDIERVGCVPPETLPASAVAIGMHACAACVRPCQRDAATSPRRAGTTLARERAGGAAEGSGAGPLAHEVAGARLRREREELLVGQSVVHHGVSTFQSLPGPHLPNQGRALGLRRYGRGRPCCASSQLSHLAQEARWPREDPCPFAPFSTALTARDYSEDVRVAENRGMGMLRDMRRRS